MLSHRSKARTVVLALMLLLVGFAGPLLAGTTDCYDHVLANCDDALDAAAWWEKPAVGLFCTAMLGGCVGDGWFN